MKIVIEVELEENKRSDNSTYLEITSVKKDGVEINSEFDDDECWVLLFDEGGINLDLIKQCL